MSTLETDMMARMSDWLDRREERQKSAEDKKREAWGLWKKHAAYQHRTLREIIDGSKASDLPAEREVKERELFEEFWAEETA